MNFSSDTSAPAHPRVLEALVQVNSGMAPSYGTDETTLRLNRLVSDVFETDVSVLPVISGTASNALALSLFCGPMESVLCHEHAHIERDERGAPEFYSGGGKLYLLPGEHGCISADALKAVLGRIDRNFVHETPPAAVSLTNLTESGAAYSVSEIESLAGMARDASLTVHMDGARLANALVSTGASPAEMTWKAGVDCLSLGLTKTGAMGCELIILFGESRSRFPELLARAKRAGHLPPKMRYVSAQAEAMLSGGLWLDLAVAANSTARALGRSLSAMEGVRIAHPVQGNEVFAYVPDPIYKSLLNHGLKAYPWLDGSIRFVCHWGMSEGEVSDFDVMVKSIGKSG